MATVTAATLTDLLKDTVSVTTAEACLQQAIDAINLEGTPYNVEIADLTGAALSKTGSYTGAEKAGIIQVATAVYSQNYKTSGAASSSSQSLGMGGLSSSESSSNSSSSSSGSSSLVNAIAREVVLALKENDVSYG
jgi:hypothetical protein